MVAALVHWTGKVLLLSTSEQIFNINDLKYGYRLKQIIDIWYSGHCEPEDFMHLIIRVISWSFGGEKLKGIFGCFNFGIQEGIVNPFVQFTHFNELVK